MKIRLTMYCAVLFLPPLIVNAQNDAPAKHSIDLKMKILSKKRKVSAPKTLCKIIGLLVGLVLSGIIKL